MMSGLTPDFTDAGFANAGIFTPGSDGDRATTAAAAPLAGGDARVVLDAADIQRALTRMAHEILERNKGAHQLLLLGVPTRGVTLAKRLAARIRDVDGIEVPTGALDVTMYRDDLRIRPARALEHTDIPDGGIDGKIVVLVDDVLFSGRSVRAALTALDDLGRPQAVRLAVLIDRGHRELPIRPDHVGKNLPTSRHEKVQVRLAETDGRDIVLIASTDVTS